MWREQRRLFHQHLGKTQVEQYYGTILKEARDFVVRLQANPNSVEPEFRLTAVKLILGVTYGLEIKSANDPYLQQAEGVAKAILKALSPGAFFVDLIPAMEYIPNWFPGANWRRWGEEWGRKYHELVSMPFEQVKRDLVAGVAVPSFTSQILEEDKDEGETETSDESKMWLSGTMYFAGADTTVTAVMRFIFAMVVHPEVQAKAHAELDLVVGKDRLPNFTDKDNLPYIDSVMKEVLRWNMMTPLSVPRRLTQDFVYKGYHLPKGATIMPNSWAISMDPLVFPEPEKFIPERFMPSSDPAAIIPIDPRLITFGYGRRICPGKDFAEAVLWSIMVHILTTTAILKPLDVDGKEFTPPAVFSGDLLSFVEPFDCRIQVRSASALKMATEESAAAA